MTTNNPFSHLSHTIVTIYIVLMATQIIALEGFSISPIKVVAMLFAPLIILTSGYIKLVSDALVYGGVFLLTMTICAM